MRSYFKVEILAMNVKMDVLGGKELKNVTTTEIYFIRASAYIISNYFIKLEALSLSIKRNKTFFCS